MADKVDTGSFADFLLLGNTYDRRARLAPGLIMTLPVTVALMFVAGAGTLTEWYETLGVGVVSQLSLTVVFGYLAHSMGSGTEYLHMTDPHGPLVSFLCKPSPKNADHGSIRRHSPQQRQAWRQAAYSITGIDLCSKKYMRSDPVFDVYKRLVVNICGSADSGTCIAAAHGEEYGFARNIVAVAPLWMLLATLGTIVVAYTVAFEHVLAGWIGLSFELLFLAAAMLVYWNGREFINTTGERFIESLLDRAADRADAKPDSLQAMQSECPEVASENCVRWLRASRDLAPKWRAVYPSFMVLVLAVVLGAGGQLHAEPARLADEAEAWAQQTLGPPSRVLVRTIPIGPETALAEKRRLHLKGAVAGDNSLELLTECPDYECRYYFSYRRISSGTLQPLSRGVIAVFKHDKDDRRWLTEVYSGPASRRASR